MPTERNDSQNQILGAALVELFNGGLSGEAVAALDRLNPETVPEPLKNLVGMVQGVRVYEPLRQDMIGLLLTEIGDAAREASVKLEGQSGSNPDAWWLVQPLLFQALESKSHSELIDEMIALLPDPQEAVGWTAPLIERARSTKARGKELTLELLDELERMVQRRRKEVNDTP
jgi:hypothetical protein